MKRISGSNKICDYSNLSYLSSTVLALCVVIMASTLALHFIKLPDLSVTLNSKVFPLFSCFQQGFIVKLTVLQYYPDINHISHISFLLH